MHGLCTNKIIDFLEKLNDCDRQKSKVKNLNSFYKCYQIMKVTNCKFE